MIDKIKLLEKSIELGSTKKIEDLEKILIELNIDNLIENKKKNFRLEIWNKESDINGISAKKIIDSRQYDIDQVYLVYINNNLVYFQDHNPNKSGFVKMTIEDVTDIGNNFIEDKATQLVLDDIYSTIIQKMLEKKEVI